MNKEQIINGSGKKFEDCRLQAIMDLIGGEFSIIELSNKLQGLGCEDICEFGNWKEILKDGNVIVATDEHGEEHIKIDFEITCNNAEDEVIEATCILITDIEEF